MIDKLIKGNINLPDVMRYFQLSATSLFSV